MYRVVGALLSLVCLAPLARGQDKDWKWDPLKHPKAKALVGDKFYAEADESEKQAFTATVDGKPAQSKDQDVRTVYRYSGETLKVENDKAADSRFKIEKWTRTSKGEKDTSLEGKTIVIKGSAAEKTWECSDKDAQLSDEAKAWVVKELVKKPKPGAKDDDDDKAKRALFPEKGIGDGDEWTRDVEPIVKDLFGGNFEVEKEKSSFKGKLSKVRVEGGVHYGHIELKLTLKVKSSEQWSEGGDMELTLATDGSLEEHKRQSASEKVTFTFKLENKKDTDKGAVDVKLNMDREGTKSHGPLEGK
jgi:hypothetical protein